MQSFAKRSKSPELHVQYISGSILEPLKETKIGSRSQEIGIAGKIIVKEI